MLVSEGSSGGDIVKVLDFGLVKAFSSDLMEKSDTELTQAGVLLGSPLYMAPEQARAETDQRTDIYSLGVLLFQCIAGRPPFQGRESLDIIVKHVKERPPELNALRPDIPFDVNALVMKCLEKDPDRRYQSMDEVIDGMRAAVAGQGLSGFFVDPRTSSGAASPSISQSVRTSGATRMRIASPSFDALPVSASEGGRRLEPDDPSLEFEITDTAARSTRRRATVIVSAVGVVVGGVIIGGVLALRHVTDKSDSVVLSTTQPSSTSKPGRSNEPGPNRASSKTVPTNVEVTFDVDSEPTGATVTSNGQLVGTTPFSFRLVRTTDAPVQAELMFSLDGYVGTTVLAKGSEGHVPLRPTLLRKKAGPVTKPAPKSSQKTSKPSNDNGYKDDPYQ
jgi:serine/threonine-protein kinase